MIYPTYRTRADAISAARNQAKTSCQSFFVIAWQADNWTVEPHKPFVRIDSVEEVRENGLVYCA